MMKRFVPVLAACLFLMFGTAQAATSLALPPPDTKGGKPLMQTLSGRATNRTFTAKPLSDKLLGDLLWAAYGVNRPNGKRTIPTAQNRQDLEIYVLRSSGAWLYDAPKHSLKQVTSSDLRRGDLNVHVAVVHGVGRDRGGVALKVLFAEHARAGNP